MNRVKTASPPPDLLVAPRQATGPPLQPNENWRVGHPADSLPVAAGGMSTYSCQDLESCLEIVAPAGSPGEGDR